jgi:hypothetical protein
LLGGEGVKVERAGSGDDRAAWGSGPWSRGRSSWPVADKYTYIQYSGKTAGDVKRQEWARLRNFGGRTRNCRAQIAGCQKRDRACDPHYVELILDPLIKAPSEEADLNEMEEEIALLEK